SVPDSLAISIPISPSPSPAAVAAIGHRAGAGTVLDRVPPRVGVHDLGDQSVADHVGAGELREMHVVHTIEDVLNDPQPGDLTTWQVDLRDVTGDHDLGTEPEPGQEHLHLLGGRVLRLVQDDERVVEGAATHVGQRGDLDGPGGHQLGDG